MRRALNHSAMPAIGFIEPWSVKAGAGTNVHVSCVEPGASVRIVSIDRDVTEVFDWHVNRMRPAFSIRDYDLGSWIELPVADIQSSGDWSCSFEFLCSENKIDKPLLSAGSIGVWVDPAGCLTVRGVDTSYKLALVANERWYQLLILRSAGTTEFVVVSDRGVAIGTAVVGNTETGMPTTVLIGSDAAASTATFNGRIGRISTQSAGHVHSWRFPTKGLIGRLASAEDSNAVLTIHNLPTFSVASARFTGEIHDPRLDPSHFDAVHLHDDDFGGFEWSADLVVDVPPDARSGAFAVEISTSEGVERLPFFVRSAKPRSSLAFLVPTSTYLSYADERLPPLRYPWHGTDRGHRFAIDNDFLCLYDVHSDLSGVSLTSARRPKATLRDDYHYPLSNCPHLLPVDLQLLKFYARNGIEIDVLTDRDLHDDGVVSIAPYRGLMTGSHPEYWSTPMMKALDHYLDGGGNLAYLGGNGFYWVVAYEGQTMELRRVKSDIWTGRPGEAHMSITGEPGGNWEDRGLRHPQTYLGVTYLIMSFGPSRPYGRLEGSRDPAFAWLFAGVGDAPIGTKGTVLGGAAGYEIDAVIRCQGTPASLVRLASADGFDDSFQVRPDIWLADGDIERETLRRADMTIYRHSGGGQVFCTGSVAWIGALPEPDSENAVGRIMLNLAQGFSA
ncbi:N,N-dimethylformamidase [Rhizobium aquaticum]|uniref:N,N-dimethylformamidase n=1 Tax=Rhizobium aquaticum TaxID=1549636 RepID=A0ABV2J5K8_9HYPH